jgi:signal transduction histidine kinase
MSQEQQRRAFTSLLSTTKRTGTGLGLAIVRRIVEAHQGKLSLRSHPGQGTVMRLVLPCQPDVEQVPHNPGSN